MDPKSITSHKVPGRQLPEDQLEFLLLMNRLGVAVPAWCNNPNG